MEKNNSLKKIQKYFKAVVQTVNTEFGEGYATKNPGLVQHLMDKIQQEEDRVITQEIHSIGG